MKQRRNKQNDGFKTNHIIFILNINGLIIPIRKTSDFSDLI